MTYNIEPNTSALFVISSLRGNDDYCEVIAAYDCEYNEFPDSWELWRQDRMADKLFRCEAIAKAQRYASNRDPFTRSWEDVDILSNLLTVFDSNIIYDNKYLDNLNT